MPPRPRRPAHSDHFVRRPLHASSARPHRGALALAPSALDVEIRAGEDTIGALIRIGWALFSIAPTNNRFNLAAWKSAIAGLSNGSEPKRRLLEDLVTLGVLVPAGFDELGDRCWSFAHRTLLEYLAARELASRTTDEWLEQVRGHFWFAPEWTEVLTFLASIVPDATPLIIAVDREEDDIFGSMLELRARLVGVARQVSAARYASGCLGDSGDVPDRHVVESPREDPARRAVREMRASTRVGRTRSVVGAGGEVAPERVGAARCGQGARRA